MTSRALTIEIADGFDEAVLMLKNQKELNEVEELACKGLTAELLEKLSFKLIKNRAQRARFELTPGRG